MTRWSSCLYDHASDLSLHLSASEQVSALSSLFLLGSARPPQTKGISVTLLSLGQVGRGGIQSNTTVTVTAAAYKLHGGLNCSLPCTARQGFMWDRLGLGGYALSSLIQPETLLLTSSLGLQGVARVIPDLKHFTSIQR